MTLKRITMESQEDLSLSKIPTSLAYRPFPPVMKVYYQWNPAGLSTFHVCGENQQDRLFAVKVRTGLIIGGPLRTAPGVYLYNGPTTNDPLLAAAGNDWGFLQAVPVNNNTRILLLEPKKGGSTWEMMRAYITSDKHVAFRYSVGVGYGLEMHRRIFEWRKINKSERDESAEHGGFKLFFLSTRLEQNATRGESSGHNVSASSAAALEDEVVAILEWRRFFESPKHPFDLKLMGSGLAGKLGERCTLMVLITALRLWELHANFRTLRGNVAVAGMIGPKEKPAP